VAVSVDSYVVEIKLSARKELEALPDNVLSRVIRKMESLGQQPRPAGCKKLKGYTDQWRVRVGDWRLLYVIDDADKLVSITRIAHRRDVYE
jgi:mRNA interferase RelE/StbE